MIRLSDNIHLAQAILDKLEEYQQLIDAKDTFAEKSNEAKRLFPLRNKKSNRTFKAVKKALTELCNSTRRCTYCEDSIGDEVEHIYPKNIYPEKCFEWENYLYACGPCNGPKSDKFAVFRDDNGSYQEVNWPRGASPVEPPTGNAVMINPREEDPFDYAILDLRGSFNFVPLPDISQKDKKRAEYTFTEILRLDHSEREPLRIARKNALGMYKARLAEYVARKDQGADQSELNNMKQGILSEDHPTVWKEMIRYYQWGIIEQVNVQLKQYFDRAPEVLDW